MNVIVWMAEAVALSPDLFHPIRYADVLLHEPNDPISSEHLSLFNSIVDSQFQRRNVVETEHGN